jgi:hypothetical protein
LSLKNQSLSGVLGVLKILKARRPHIPVFN